MRLLPIRQSPLAIVDMRISQHYQLNRTQPDLDFVDVDATNDVTLFIDPRALRLLKTNWGDWCVHLLRDFFENVLGAIRVGDMEHARRLLSRLREPNETRLGFSHGRARGRGLGSYLAGEVADSLSHSVAIHSGLLRDLEDSILMIEGISSDLISDITTNVIREPLIFYTQFACQTYGIPLQADVNSGPLWDADKDEWHSTFVSLPIAENRPLVLVPKAIVRLKMDYDVDEYYRHYMLERLIRLEKDANTELVHLLRDGRERVYKKDVREKYGEGKRAIVRLTREHPEVLEEYRINKREYIRPPLDHDTL